jgi:NAD(P)H-dependent FMN reductase
MRFALINGSPRGARGNTAVLLAHLTRGLQAAGCATEVEHLSLPHSHPRAKALFCRCDRVLVAFPLYTDAMPGQVMAFFESLEELCGRANNPSIAFLVQSGFPEAGQSRAVEHWLGLLAKRLGTPYLGTIVKGNVEGIQVMPAWMTAKLFKKIERIGFELGASDRLDPKALRALAGPDWISPWRLPFVKPWIPLGAASYWNGQLKANGTFARRFDRPFADTGTG